MKLGQTYNEDCLVTMSKMPESFVDLTVTSPPYDDLRDYRGYTFEFEKIAQELFRVTKEGGVVVWVVADRVKDHCESGTSFRQALYFKEQAGFNLFDTMIYLKAGFGAPGSAKSYYQLFEYMFVFSKGAPKTTNLIEDKKNRYAGETRTVHIRQKDGTTKKDATAVFKEFGRRGNVWRYAAGYLAGTPDKIAYEHPATFPEALARDHILSWSNEGDIVYDPFMGSGTVAKMAMENDREWIGSEISSEYCEIIKKRLELAKYRLL